MTKEEMAEIAELAAEKAVEKALQRMYVEIGKGVLKKAAFVIGVGVVALAIWLNAHGFK